MNTEHPTRYPDAQPGPLARVVIFSTVAFLLIALLWAGLGHIDVVAQAQGTLIPSTRLQIVQPMEGGRVAAILVSEGQPVKAGEPLLRMDPVLTGAELARTRAEVALAELQLRRIDAELGGHELTARPDDPPGLYAQAAEQFQAHRHELASRLAQQEAVLEQTAQSLRGTRALIEKIRAILPIQQESETVFRKLNADGFAAKLAFLEKQKERLEAEKELASQEASAKALEAKIVEVKSQRAETEANYRRTLADERIALEQKLAGSRADLIKQNHLERLLELRSPADGVVKEIAYHTVGSVVPAGTVVMKLVPRNDPLKAEVLIDNKDIGFVRQGQTARMKLTSYEFQRYGTLAGAVEQVAADAAEKDPRDGRGNGESSGFKAWVTLDRQVLASGARELPLSAGMQVVAEIRIGERTVLEYLLSPVLRAVDEAGRER